MQTLSVVIPVYNEKNTIAEIIDAVLKSSCLSLNKEIIVIDDCSTDGTLEVLGRLKNENKNIKIFVNEKNEGKGFSVRKGLSISSGDFIIIQDADLEYDPNQYGSLLKSLLENSADVVYGSRFLEGKFVLKPYYLANKFLTFLSNIFTRLNLTDMETCYKCFTRSALLKILPRLSADKFEIEPEITARLAGANLRVKEIGVSYNRRSRASGKKIGWQDGLKAVWTILKN